MIWIIALNKIKIKLLSQKGAVDKILVTLLFIVIGVAALVGLEQWTSDHKNNMMNISEKTINAVMNE